jgi:hypothetical protein
MTWVRLCISADTTRYSRVRRPAVLSIDAAIKVST